MKTLIIKTLLFTAVISFVIYKIDPFFVDDNIDFRKFYFFYDEKKDSNEVIFLGNSHANNGIITEVVEAKCDINAYNLSFTGINLFSLYYNLEEALKTQSPQLIVIETFPFFFPGMDSQFINQEGKMSVNGPNSIYAKRVGLTKLKESNLAFSKSELYKSFNIFRRHDSWDDLKGMSEVFGKYLSPNNKGIFKDHYRDMSILPSNKATKYHDFRFKNNNEISISKDQKLFLEKIIQLSKDKSFKLLFVTLPFYPEYYKSYKTSYVKSTAELQEIIKSYPDIKVLDQNTLPLNLNRTYFRNDKNLSHNQHLNYKGAIKASSNLANFINTNYNFSHNKKHRKITPENLIYNKAELLGSKKGITGEITTVNNRTFASKTGRGVIKLAKNEGKLKIDGWIYHEGINLKKAEKIIGLKKDDDFVFISASEQLNDREDPLLVKKYGKAYKYSGYSFSILRALLEPGTYKIYHLLRTENGDLLISDTNKDVII